jgi:hypothetical protein
MATPRVMWYAEREEIRGDQKNVVHEEIGEFSDFQSEDERKRWKAFIDSKGGFDAFTLKYPRIFWRVITS